MPPIIRKVKEGDAKELIPLMLELGYSLTELELQNNINEIIKRNGIILIAETNYRIIGCVCAIFDIRLAEGAYGEIVSLVVAEDFRGFGLGKKLTKQAEKWLSQRVTSIRIRANAKRSEAHIFYKSLGFKEIKMQKILLKEV